VFDTLRGKRPKTHHKIEKAEIPQKRFFHKIVYFSTNDGITLFFDFGISKHNNEWGRIFFFNVKLNKLSSILLPQSAID